MNNMVDIQRSYAYLPKEMVGGTTKPEPTLSELNSIGKFPYTDFDVLGDTSPVNINTNDLDGSIKDATSRIFDIQKTNDGTLFISKRSFTVDLQDREVPRALLITQKGNDLMKEVPGILKLIDRGELPERNPKTKIYGSESINYGWSGRATVVELPNGKSVVVKRFNRFNLAKDMITVIDLPDGQKSYDKKYSKANPANGIDGRRMAVGGLEVAQFTSALEKSELGSRIRHPDIYFASQDILVMENIEDLQPAMEACDVRPDLYPTVRAMKNWINIVAQRILGELSMLGAIDRKYEQNLYVDGNSLEIDNIKLIWLDPIV